MDLRIAIVDDDQHDREALAGTVVAALEAMPEAEATVGQYASAEDLLDTFVPGSLNLAFLDVRMGGMDGLNLAEILRAADPSLLIVFVTTMADYALDAYPTHPFDFLVKPWTRERVARVLSDVVRALSYEEPTLSIPIPYGTIEVVARNIVYLEAQDHTVTLHTADGPSVHTTLRYAEATNLLASYPSFLEVNRGVLVNLDHATNMEEQVIVMDDGARLPLRRRDRPALARAITQYMISRVGRTPRG